MPACGFTLILGAVLGIVTAVAVYVYDWNRMTKENNEIREINAELIELLKVERAINEFLGHNYREEGE